MLPLTAGRCAAFRKAESLRKKSIMSRFISLSIHDFRNILRDPELRALLFLVPVLTFLATRYALPFLTEQYPILNDFQMIIRILLSLQVVMTVGFVIASILLDEKDEGVMTALRVLPVGADLFLAYRLIVALLISLLFGWGMLFAAGPAALSMSASWAGAILLALVTPIITLILAGFARDKVEGLSFFKALSFIIVLPGVALLLNSTAQYLFAPIPTFWTFLFLEKAAAGEAAWLEFSVAVLFHSLVIGGCYAWFKRKVF
jgi:fluoroquinolone transport system permease protein